MFKKYVLMVMLILLPTSAFAGDSLSFFRKQIDNMIGITSHPSYPDSIKNSFINDACRQIVNLVANQAPCIEKQDTIVLASGTIQYDLNTDCYGILAVQPKRMARSALDYIATWDAGKSTGGGLTNVVKYAKAGSKILFDPIPSAVDTLVVFYNAYATNLSGANDTTTIPPQYRELIPLYAYAKCKIRTKEFSEANWAISFFEQELARTIVVLANQRYNLIVAPKVVSR